MVTRRHHIRNAFNYSFQPLKHSVPLKLVLTVVAVVADGQNESAFGMLFQSVFQQFADLAVIRQMAGIAFLMVSDDEKAEFSDVLRLGFKRKFIASVFLRADGVDISCSRFKPRKLHGIIVADVNIAFFPFAIGVKPPPIGFIFFFEINKSRVNLNARPPYNRRLCFRVAAK